MSTRSTINLLFWFSQVISVLMLLPVKVGDSTFVILGVGLGVVGWALMFYALYREQSLGDKSETVPMKGSAAIFGGIALLVGFLLFRALAG